MALKYCNRCDAQTETKTVIQQSGPHYAKEGCAVCGKYYKWLKKPATETQAINTESMVDDDF